MPTVILRLYAQVEIVGEGELVVHLCEEHREGAHPPVVLAHIQQVIAKHPCEVEGIPGGDGEVEARGGLKVMAAGEVV